LPAPEHAISPVKRVKRSARILAAAALSAALQSNADLPEYGTNPYAFPVQDQIWGWWECFFAADLNGDGLPDYTYRSRTTVYAYGHDGGFLWSAAVGYPAPAVNNHCAKHGAADVDGDGQVEIVALDSLNRVLVFNGANGTLENTIAVTVGSHQIAGHVAVADLRGVGDRDCIVQTVDDALEGEHFGYYLNRSLVAINLETGSELWRVNQDRDPANGLYEGYWGPAHGPFAAADVDLDGRDEVVGGNMIDHDGRIVDVGYPRTWLSYADVPGTRYADHLDAINVGDFRPDLPGLEWVVTEEDHLADTPGDRCSWNTGLVSRGGVLWRREIETLGDLEDPYYQREREPQNAATGNFSPSSPFSEIWLSSRGPTRKLDHQHPWVFHSDGVLTKDYNIGNRLPAGFNTYPGTGNAEGIEPVCTIDWFGGRTDQIAAAARHVDGHFGVFDAMTGTAFWSTAGSTPAMQAAMLYVADVAGDSREEILVYDKTDAKIKIYWNADPNPNQPKLNKWDDPLYARLKQNWNYYQPGGYTYGDYPLISDIEVVDVTTEGAVVTWQTDAASDSQVEYGPTDAYGSETPRDGTPTLSHSVALTGLAADADVHFRVKSRNAYGKTGLSADSVLSTLPVLVSVRIWLEGSFDAGGDSLETSLNRGGLLPFTSPFAEDTAEAPEIPGSAVDWVLVQLRTRPDTSASASAGAWLRNDGWLMTLDGAATSIPLSARQGNYHVVVRHRNHLSVMTESTLPLDPDAPQIADFASGLTPAYGVNGLKALASGRLGLWAGDANGSGTVDAADRSVLWNRRNRTGYMIEDCNLSGTVDAADRSIGWNNRNRITAVP
jgi:hypothetical protein